MSTITDPEIPYVGRVKDGFEDGHLVRIQGRTSSSTQRFNINLQCDGSEHADIAVHVSVRVQEGYVARNSFENGEWGEEQGDGNLTIGMGQKFEIIILSGSNDYKIAINGQHFCEFPRRVAPEKITHLKIDGDVDISVISYEGGDLAKSSSTQQNAGYGQPQQNYGGYGGYGPPPQQGGYGGYGPPGAQGAYGPPQGGYQPYNQQGGYGPGAPPPGYHQVSNDTPNPLGLTQPSAPSAPPGGLEDDRPTSIYPHINNPTPYLPNNPTAGINLPSYPILPGSNPQPAYPMASDANSFPGFRPTVPGFGSYSPTSGNGPPSPYSHPRNLYPMSPSGYPGPYPNYPGYPSGNNYPGYGNYQANAGDNASPVPPGYTVFKPPGDNYQKDSSTMDKVKKYGLPIIGAGVATYALSKLTDGFGLGGHSSDSD